MGNQLSDKETREAQRRFLIAYSKTGNWSHACGRAGVTPSTVRKWEKRDDKFRKKLEQRQEQFIDMLEMVAVQRAVEKSDTLLQMLLKANRPQKYRENVKLDADVKQDKTVRLVFSPDEVAEFMPNYAHGEGVTPDGAEQEETGESE